MKLATELLPETDEQRSTKRDIAEMEGMVTELLETEKLKSPFGGLVPFETDLVKFWRN
jgi:hypothetical protein